MPTLTDLQEKRGTLIAQARERLNQIDANTDEARATELQTQHDAAMAELDKLDARIATEENLAFPYLNLWAFPDKVYREPSVEGEVHGLGASAGVIEGTARLVLSPEEFSAVKPHEIVVCRMTSPAWVVLFTKISGLVTDAGGMASHPAVVSREFGIPAVVGTSDATRKIKTGDRVRVNGSTGIVEVLT